MAEKRGNSVCCRTITRKAKDDSKNLFGILSDRKSVFFIDNNDKKSISIVFKTLNDPLGSSADFTSSSTFFTYNVDENSLVRVDMPDCVKNFILNFVNSNLLSINSQSNQSVFEKTTRLAAGK